MRVDIVSEQDSEGDICIEEKGWRQKLRNKDIQILYSLPNSLDNQIKDYMGETTIWPENLKRKKLHERLRHKFEDDSKIGPMEVKCECTDWSGSA